MADIQVGDVGTVYRARLKDKKVGEFNPAGATVMKLLFRLPGVSSIVEREATPTSAIVGEVVHYYLTYKVVAGDVNFHGTPGKVRVQGYLEYANGDHWKSSVQSKDKDGNELEIHENL